MEKPFYYHWEAVMSKFKLTVLSPVHIGDNENKNLNSLSDFVVEKNEVKIIDKNKLEQLFFENQEIMEDYIKEVSYNSGRNYNLNIFLKKYNINSSEILSEKKIPLIGHFTGKEIHSFISENGNNYLPGSSIKGVIRNALAYEFMKKTPELISAIEHKSFNSKPNFSYEEKQIFGRNPFNDILKYLQISDSMPFPNATAIYTTYNYHLKNHNKTVPINNECLKPNAVSEFRINIKKPNPKILDNLNYDFWNEYLSYKGICKSLNNFSLRFINNELSAIKEINDLNQTISFYNNLIEQIANAKENEAFFCIGKGTTIMGKTILLALEDETLSKLREKMKNTRVNRNFGWKLVDRRELKKSDKLPIIRLVYQNLNQLQAGMGWIKMEEI